MSISIVKKRIFSKQRVSVIKILIKEILNAFSREAINALVIRGPALAYSVYPETALRPCDHIDLLVKPALMTLAQTVPEK